MSHRFSQNGKPLTEHHGGEYVKNEVDVKLDRLTDLWTKVERKLLNEQPPRRITCVYHPQESERAERRFLGIQRHSGKWRGCSAPSLGFIPAHRGLLGPGLPLVC